MDKALPITDLKKLRVDILDKGPEAALPSQLSDYWLDLLMRDYEEFISTTENHSDGLSMAGPVALILKILMYKAGEHEVTIPDDVMLLYFADYKSELTIELLRRTTGLTITPATLETIFTDRRIEVARALRLHKV